MLMPTSYVLPEPDYIARGRSTSECFCNIFLSNTEEDQKKSYQKRGTSGLRHMVSLAVVIVLFSWKS